MITAMIALAIVVCLALSFFFSGSETAVVSVNRYRLTSLHEQGDASSGHLLEMLADTQRLLVMVLIGTNVANVLLALFFRLLVERIWPASSVEPALGFIVWSEVLSLLILTPIVILMAEILPKTLFRAHADDLVRSLRLVFMVCLFIFKPAIVLTEKVARWVLTPLSEQRTRAMRQLTRRDVINLITPEEESPTVVQGEDGNPLGEAVTREAAAEQDRFEERSDERRMIHNIMELHETHAYEIMTPLVELVAVQLGRVDLDGLRALAHMTGYTRFPVYHDRIVNLTGFIDIYRVLRDVDAGKSIEDYVEPAYYVPETKRVDQLLREFLQRRAKNAIVVDEYGGCVGWISREDMLEEIVGELEDELDVPGAQINEVDEGVYQVDGRTEIDSLNQALGAEFDDEEWETLAGMLLDRMGRIPSVGDEVQIGPWKVRILRMDHHRIDQVELRRAQD